MKSILLVLSLLLAAALLSACLVAPIGDSQTIEGSGTLAEETRTTSAFDVVELSMPGTLHIESGASVSLRVSAEDNLLPYIETDTGGGKLQIRTRPGINVRARLPIDFYLTVPSLDGMRTTSSGNIEAADLVTTHFQAAITSSGSITLQGLQAETLEVEISSSGGVTILGGAVESQTIRISSSGEYLAKQLQSAEASVRLASSGTATLRVSDRLDGSLTSSGNLYYLGSPQVSVNTDSSGRTIQITD